ncbi:hypothetical protein DH2020_042162 [Rehmannia glutinosa]|uniref:BHLH domain-containing protein n=1 Tax=Rehmannia glutinosa TaxID=99300 RepID=A0ABR0UPG6_REHGL
MNSNQPYFPGQPMQPLADQYGYYTQNAPMASVFNGGFVPPSIEPLMPFHNVAIQPSDACPKNLVIFDQTSHRSQIMFHPEISPTIFYPGFGVDNIDQKDTIDEIRVSSPFKEDSDDIDALLSTEDDEIEECDDDDEISTARTDAGYECNSPDSCSNFEPKYSESRYNGKKRQRMRKMVTALKGIVPGGNQMSTVAVLDEAVRYLKSLKMDMQKMGIRNSKALPFAGLRISPQTGKPVSKELENEPLVLN